jgi:hypothetical protein
MQLRDVRGAVAMSGHPDSAGSRPFPFLKSYPVNLQRANAEPHERLTGHVIGAVTGQRIVLCGVAASALMPGDDVVVRMAVGSSVLGFRTRVEEAYGTQVTLHLLAMPEKVESLNLRKGQSMNLFVPADVQYSRGQPSGSGAQDLALLQGRMLNLSREGCCLSTKRPIAANQPIRLAFALPGARNTYRLDAKVLRHLGAPREGVFMQGVQFDKQTHHLPVLADLQQWISQNLPYAMGN